MTIMQIGNNSAEHLRQFIERVERLNTEKTDITTDIKEIFHEAKISGFDVKTMRELVKLRKKQPNEIEEQQHLLDTYMRALGMMPELSDEERSHPKTKVNITIGNKTYKNVDLEALNKLKG